MAKVYLGQVVGPKGDRGEKGDPGTQGIQGDTGAKGDKGDQGIQGVPGAKGDKGDQGIQGIQGIQGVKGDKGDKGDTGAKGSQGIAGPNLISSTTGVSGFASGDLLFNNNGKVGSKSLSLDGKIDKTAIVNNLTTGGATNVLSAQQGVELSSAIGQNTSDLNAHKADYASLFLTNADAKNSIYRGKYLGSTVTPEQYTAISSGTFTDLYIGDYWTIGGINYRIAAFNYYRNTGDINVPGNHITIVPDTQLYTHVMNDTNITTGGYTGSKMYTVGLEQAKTTIRGIFGTHLVKHRQIHSNATVDGKASGWAWVDSEVDLMSEIMVYGSVVWGGSTIGGSGYNIGVGKSQLPLFRLNPRMINTRQTYWLRDVVSASRFAAVGGYGNASYNSASDAFGVRPAFSIS